MIKHTGPWGQGYSTEPSSSSPPASAIYGDGGRWVCSVSEASVPTTEEYANAHLIAAAPDLLAALEHVDSVGGLEYAGEIDFDCVKSAIAKAKGEAE